VIRAAYFVRPIYARPRAAFWRASIGAPRHSFSLLAFVRRLLSHGQAPAGLHGGKASW
jgi:hypothetical protein